MLEILENPLNVFKVCKLYSFVMKCNLMFELNSLQLEPDVFIHLGLTVTVTNLAG